MGLCVPVFVVVLLRHKMRTRHLHFLPHSRFFGSILPSTIILSADNHKQGDWMGGCYKKEVADEGCAASCLLAASWTRGWCGAVIYPPPLAAPPPPIETIGDHHQLLDEIHQWEGAPRSYHTREVKETLEEELFYKSLPLFIWLLSCHKIEYFPWIICLLGELGIF